MITVTTPGTGGMMPLKNRWLSTCLLTVNGHSVLIDCGEGAQIALKAAGRRFKPIDVICITHFHADHISGLPGFLLTMCSEGRTEPVTMVGPRGLEQVVRSLCIIAPNLTFPISFVEVSGSTPPLMNEGLRIKPFFVRHGITCLGYTFELDRPGRFDPEKARRNNVPLCLWNILQHGGTAERDGTVYTPEMVLGPQRKGLKVTYTTDTRPVRSIVENSRDADLLICEGMFGNEEKLPRAKETHHMMFSEAAAIAAEAAAKRLWLTHFSPSLSVPEEEISAAKAVFPQAECAFDGRTIDLRFEDE